MGKNHWVLVPFAEAITALESGSRPKGGVKGISEGVPSIGAEHLSSDGGFDFSNIRYIPKAFADKMKRGKLQSNDILIVKDGATTGKVSLVSPDFPHQYACVNEHVFICRINSGLDAKYFYYYLRSDDGQAQIMSTFHGGAQGGINSEFVNSIVTPLPPINEQKRIVEKLDTLLPKVKSAKARLEKIPAILKKFRQSVLAAACSGRLTEDWREGKDLPEWETKNLFEIIIGKPRNGYSGKPVKYETETKVLTLSATTSGVFKDGYFKYLDENINPDAYCWLKTNDILLQRGNTLEYVGVPAIYKGHNNLYIYPDLMIRLIANEHIIFPNFLYYYLSNDEIRNFMRDNAVGTAGSMPKINQQVLAKIVVVVPDLNEQHEIVLRVEKLFAFADSLETKYKKAMARIEKLEQSILAKAFRGELVDPDPNDEPAEELLRRIVEEKDRKWLRVNKS